MKLLLLLSALLGALTGGNVGGLRAAVPAEQVTAALHKAAVQATAPAPRAALLPHWPALTTVAQATVLPVAIFAAIPAYRDRPRE